MMRDEEKTKGQLINELTDLCGKMAEFKASKAGLQQPELGQNLKQALKLPT